MKDSSDSQISALNSYQAAKLLRGRQYSFPFHHSEYAKMADSSRTGGHAQLKKLDGNADMAKFGADNAACDDSLGRSAVNGKNAAGSKQSTSNPRQNTAK